MRIWNEHKSGILIGKWFSYKSMGYRLLIIKAAYQDGFVKMQYIFEKNGQTELMDADIPENSTIPSVTTAFPEGAQMEMEISNTFPIVFSLQDAESSETEKQDAIHVEWGPFHPLLQEPALFRFLAKDEVVNEVYVETGYNHRGVEALCIGEKIPYVLDMLERISSVNGFSIGLAFLHAVEKVNEIIIPERANFLRLIFNEMSFLRANLNSLSHITKCLGLLSDHSAFFKLISLFNEAASLITDDPQLKGILIPGGINRDISNETLLQVNVILQEMVQELSAIREKWSDTQSIKNRMSMIGKIDRNSARAMTGRISRGAGYGEDLRKLSRLPYCKLSYKVPKTEESNCFTRTMLMFDDSMLSLSLIDQAVEILPRGKVKSISNLANKGELLISEPEAFGEVVIYVSFNKEIVTDLKIRNSSSLTFSIIGDLLKGTELNDVPLVISSLDLDFSSMEK